MCAAAVVLVTGCRSGSETADAEPEMTPVADMGTSAASPSPSPSPESVVPVRASRQSHAVDVGDGTLLGPDDRDTVDAAAVTAFGDTVLGWLDAHLTDLQAGGAGRLAEVLPVGLTPDDPAVAPALTTALASPDLPVAHATYELTAYHDAGPEFATVAVTLADEAGVTRTATLAFAVAAGGEPVLVLGETEVAP